MCTNRGTSRCLANFEQGDNINGKIFKQEIAHISVAALESLAACEKTFEVWETTGSINHLIM